ncbi:MAG TPA: alginate export family protein [Bryobacteraceae bacterium]|nr:alginate export family protein [Bryobacteraceae bacterium]
MALGLTHRQAAAQTPSATPDGIASAYANSELPHWLRLGGEERVRLESLDGLGFNPAGNTYLLHRLRLNLDVTARSWLKFSLQAEDSRVFFTNVSPAPASQKDPMDLRLGYVQIGNSESSPVSLRAGRQGFTFGEGRLLADPGWSNVGRSLDGVRVTLRYRRIRLDAFSGISDKIYTDGFDTPTPGEHFHGLYGSIDKLIPNSTIEPYLFWRLEHNVKGEVIKTGNLDARTAGLRWVGKLPLGFDYGLEMAIERGRQANELLSAWAGHWVVGHTLADAKHRPRLFAEWNRASGDHNPRDGVHGAFDPLFPSSHDKFGTADQFTWTNIVYARGGFQYRAWEKLSLTAAYNSFWLADRHDGIYSGGKIIIASNGSQKTHIGQEADIQGQWIPSRFTLVDLALGHTFPASFSTTPAATQVITACFSP